MPQHTAADTTPTRTRTYDHVPAIPADSAMEQDAPTHSGLQWHDQYDQRGYPVDDNTEQDRGSIISETTTPDQKFDGQIPAELADQVDISLKDAVAAFRISKEQYHVHPTPSQKTRELAAEVYRLTHGGDTWMENMVESAVEAARCATRDYDDLKGMVTGLIEQIKTLEYRLNSRIDNVQNQTLAAIKSIPAPAVPQQETTAASAALGPLFNPTRRNLTTTRPTPPKPAVASPAEAHHQSRLIIQILPDGVKPDDRPDPRKLVDEINNCLVADGVEPEHLMVVAVKWNNNGNCIVSTRSDQTAAELAKHAPSFTNLITKGKEAIVREDTKWIKIQVNGVRTGAFDDIPGVYAPETVHAELLKRNPEYASLKIIQPPRWMRSREELMTTGYSSIVFAVEDEVQAERLLREVKSLAAFGRNAFLRRYADRPPVIQCKKCYKFGHFSTSCEAATPKCRLCGQDHTEAEHRTRCTKCKAEAEADDAMDTDTTCTHDMQCIHCKGKDGRDANHPSDSRRCPERLAKYGSARANDRPTQPARTSDQGWTNAPTRNRRAARQHPPQAPPTQNRFQLLDPEPQVDRVIANAASSGNLSISREQTAAAMQHVQNRVNG